MTDADNSAALLPFEAFVAHLRRQGFRVGVAHHLRLRALLNQLGPGCSPEELKTLLCPLFATNAEQQEFFYRAFDEFYPLLREAGDTRLTADAVPPEPRMSPTAVRKWPYFVAGMVVLVLGVTYLTRLTEPLRFPASIQASPDIPPASTVAPAEPKQQAQPQTPNPPAASHPTVISRVDNLPPSLFPKLAWYDQHRVALGWTAALGPFMFWIVAGLYRSRKRRLLIRSARGKVPPYSWPVRTDFVAEIYEGQEIATVCRLLHRRSQGDSERLDVAATVDASIAMLGFPSFRYRRDSRLPEYLFLIDRVSYRDHQARFHEHLAETLREQGLFVTSYFYEGDPRVCRNATGDESFHLEELQRTHRDHRLLVFGDGEQFLDAMSGRLAHWHGLFGAWTDHALLTPEPPSTWGTRELTLAHEFTVVPATLDGLAMLAAYFELPSSTNLRVEDGAEPSGFSHEVAGLRRYLGDDCFQWLCACAIYPELQWDLTLSIGSLPSMPQGLVGEQNIVKLMRLEWFRVGVMPDELRRELIAQLRPGVERDVREAIVGLLEKSPAPAGTFASSAHQFQIAYQRYRGNPADRKTRSTLKSALENLSPDEVEQDYAYLDAAESVQRSPIEFVLPKRLSKLLYPAGGPRLGMRSVVLAGAAAVLIVGSLQALKVMDRRVRTALSGYRQELSQGLGVSASFNPSLTVYSRSGISKGMLAYFGWSTSSPALKNAKSGVLTIVDSRWRTQLALTRENLNAGKAVYLPSSGHLMFELALRDEGGNQTTERVYLNMEVEPVRDLVLKLLWSVSGGGNADPLPKPGAVGIGGRTFQPTILPSSPSGGPAIQGPAVEATIVDASPPPAPHRILSQTLSATGVLPLAASVTTPKERPVGLVLTGVGSKLLRAGTETPVAARSGDILFPGDELRAETSSASFLYCPSKTSQTLEQGGDVIFGANQFDLRTGKTSDTRPVGACFLPAIAPDTRRSPCSSASQNTKNFRRISGYATPMQTRTSSAISCPAPAVAPCRRIRSSS